MGAAREKTQADFDLEHFVEMFDEALTSNDERVTNALRQLMMMVILTKPETPNQASDRNRGPLRQIFDDQRQILRRLERVEDSIRTAEYKNMASYKSDPYSYATDIAAANMAQQIDKEILSQLNKDFVTKINGGPF